MKIGNTGIVAACTAVSRILGFARISLISFLFGAGGQADVLNLVFQIPNNLRRLLAEGALSSAFIPVLNDTLPRGLQPEKRARDFVRSLFGFQLLILIPLIVVSNTLSEQITRLLFDFSSVQQEHEAAQIFRILIWYIVPISLNAICMAILNTHSQFTIPAISPLVSSVFVIAMTLLLHQRFAIYAVGIGIVIGGVAQLTIHIPSLVRNRYSLVPSLNIRNRDLHHVFKKWLFIASSTLLLFINQQVAIYFASGLEVGSGSAMVYALTFWQLPFGILGVSVITVLYPKMSAEYAQGDSSAARKTLYKGTQHLMHVLIPATIFLLCYSDDIIFLALQRGKFTSIDTMRTAATLRAYTIGLLGVALFQYGQRFYYAIHKTRFATIVLVIVVVIDIACSLWLKETRLRVRGLGFANSIAFWAGTVILYAPQLIRYNRDAKKRQARYLHYGMRIVTCTLLSSIIPVGYYLSLSIQARTLPFGARIIFLLGSACIYAILVLRLYTWFRVYPHPREFLFK